MDMLKTGWNFFQNEVVGMAWLNRLIGNLINACGLDATSKIGGGIQFFVYDTIKIMVLLGVLILGEFYQFNLSSCIRQQNSLTAQFVSFNLSNLANIFYPPQFLQ